MTNMKVTPSSYVIEHEGYIYNAHLTGNCFTLHRRECRAFDIPPFKQICTQDGWGMLLGEYGPLKTFATIDDVTEFITGNP